MLGTHFTPDQLIPLLIGSGILMIAILLRKRIELSLALLVLGALVLGYFSANLDHFLGLWDEQFHALVAKNMSVTPFTPMLYADPVMDYDPTIWYRNHIWLHKQPLFLWQMACSIKLFGANELAVRIPSILMHAAMPIFIYRIGAIIVKKEIGFIAAIIFVMSYYPLELIVGEFATDHNDTAFLFYITGSFWAWFEYQESKKAKYLILIGVFSGGAMLIKWLMGALVFVLWSLSSLVTHKRSFFTRKQLFPIIIAGLLSMTLFLPWQIYIHHQFPLESSHEFAYNGRHFAHAVEGHTGDYLFHFREGFNTLYGVGFLIPILLIGSLIVLLRKCDERIHRIFILSAICFVYLFFSMAATKMISFTIIVMPFLHLALAALIYSVIDAVSRRVKKFDASLFLMPIVLCFVGYFSLNLNEMQKRHTQWKPMENNNWQGKTLEKEFIASLNKQLPNEQYVIFNTNTTLAASIPIMFYTNHIAYMEIPTERQVKKMKNAGRRIAIYNIGPIPSYLLDDPEIVKIAVPANLIFD